MGVVIKLGECSSGSSVTVDGVDITKHVKAVTVDCRAPGMTRATIEFLRVSLEADIPASAIIATTFTDSDGNERPQRPAPEVRG